MAYSFYLSFPSTEVTDPDFEPSWLYNALADLYSDWLPAEAIESLRVDGYYSTLVMPGFRIIAVNSMYCYTLNL